MELVFAEEEVVFYLPSEIECFVMHGMGPYEQVQLQRLPSQTNRQDLVMLFLVFLVVSVCTV
tara:strand:- start:126 stop:311 length:186 start_codon:yes stop_codon:yes gene_type:complete